MFFAYTIVYLGLHLLVYRTVLRDRWPCFGTERGIFLYHTASFLAANLTVIGLGLEGSWPIWLAFMIGTHGIYSLSFLELWSLAQGSYSLALLTMIDRLGPKASATRLQESAVIGRQKSEARNADLARLWLLQDGQSGPSRLTVIGGFLAGLFWFFLRLTNGRPLNR